MITRNFEDYPEHRLQFFALLHAIVNHCFRVLLSLNPAQLKLIMDSIVWAFRHTERNVAETGLNLLKDLLQQFSMSQFATQFYQTYYLTLLQEIFAVMTDTFHKPGFKLHAHILHHLFAILSSPAITGPLWDLTKAPVNAYPDNATYVRQHITQFLTGAFPNLTPQQVRHAFCLIQPDSVIHTPEPWLMSRIAANLAAVSVLCPVWHVSVCVRTCIYSQHADCVA